MLKDKTALGVDDDSFAAFHFRQGWAVTAAIIAILTARAAITGPGGWRNKVGAEEVGNARVVIEPEFILLG